jgi:hypothetical protein
MTRKNRKQNYVAEFATAVAEPEIESVEEANELLEEAISNIDESIQTGEISQEDGEILAAQAIAEHRQILEEMLGIELEEEDDEDDEEGYDDETADYSFNRRFAQFSAQAPVAATILQLAEADGYEDVEDLINDISAYTGLDVNDVEGILDGSLVPDEELAATIADGFNLDDEDYGIFLQIAEEAAAGADPEDDDEDTEAEVNYSRFARNQNYQDRKIQQLQSQLAEFSEQLQVSDALVELDAQGRRGLEEGWLPPVAYNTILGDFETPNDRFAAFSQVCGEESVSQEVELYSIRKQLEVFEACGPLVQFGAMVEEPITPREAEMQNQIRAQAIRNQEVRMQRIGSTMHSAGIAISGT